MDQSTPLAYKPVPSRSGHSLEASLCLPDRQRDVPPALRRPLCRLSSGFCWHNLHSGAACSIAEGSAGVSATKIAVPLGVEGGGCCHELVGMVGASRMSSTYWFHVQPGVFFDAFMVEHLVARGQRRRSLLGSLVNAR